MSEKSGSGKLIPKKKEELSKPSSDLIKRGLSLSVRLIPNQISIYMENLLETYSRVKDFIPNKAFNVRHGFTFDQDPTHSNRYYCWTHSLCTHPDVVEIWFLVARGGKKYFETSLPESFFWFGAKYRERIEIFLMMHREEYKFYFMDVQDEAYWDNNYFPGNRVSKVHHQLGKALDLWETGNRHVIYGLSYGWYDSDTLQFEKEIFDSKHMEAWKQIEICVKKNPEDALPPPIMEMVKIEESTLINAHRYS
jgi:hypothetical protein